MFSGNNCTYCPEFPIFKKLVGTLPPCQIGTVNVSLPPELAELSPPPPPPKICPLIIFYINGTPFPEFGGNYTEDNLRPFVKAVSIPAYEIIGLLNPKKEVFLPTVLERRCPTSCYLILITPIMGIPIPPNLLIKFIVVSHFTVIVISYKGYYPLLPFCLCRKVIHLKKNPLINGVVKIKLGFPIQVD